MNPLALSPEAMAVVNAATRMALDGCEAFGPSASPSEPARQRREPPSAARMDDLGDLLTPSEVAALLRTTTKAVYSRIERGQIPGVVRVGRSIRVHRVTFSRWLERAVSSKEIRR